MTSIRTTLRLALVAGVTTAALAGCGMMSKLQHRELQRCCMNAASEVPPSMTRGSGMAEAWLNKDTNVLKYKITYEGLSGPATAAHFHGPATAGANAAVVLPFASPASPIEGQATLTPAQAADLMAGKWYANVHTAANPVARSAARCCRRCEPARLMETDDDTKPPAAPELRSSYLEEKAFKSRTLLIFGSITDAVAADVTRRLIALDADSQAPIDILVSSPGGHLESGDAIHDIVRFISAPVHMIGTGWVGSAATHLFLAAPRGAPRLPAQHPFPDPPAERRRRRAGHRHRHPGAGDRQGARANRPRDRARNRQAAGGGAGGHRARPLAVGPGSGGLRAGVADHRAEDRVAHLVVRGRDAARAGARCQMAP